MEEHRLELNSKCHENFPYVLMTFIKPTFCFQIPKNWVLYPIRYRYGIKDCYAHCQPIHKKNICESAKEKHREREPGLYIGPGNIEKQCRQL